MTHTALVVTDLHRATYVDEQLEGLQAIFDKINLAVLEIILGGAAGTGKTTLMRAVADAAIAAGRQILLLTPFGKAAVRLRDKTGYPCQTIHSALYGGVIEDPETGELLWMDPGIDVDRGGLVIIDEASTLGRKVYQDLIEAIRPGVSILFVGDPFQLSPVGDECGVDFKKADRVLMQIHRQAADNPVLGLATAARNGRPVEWLREYRQTDDRLTLGNGMEELVMELAGCAEAGADVVALAFTHEERKAINTRAREALGRRQMFEPGDRIIIRTNNHGIGMMNGEIFTIETTRILSDRIWGKYALVKFTEKKTPVKINLSNFGCDRTVWWDYIKRKPKTFPKNYVHADYGYCITVHSSQGSEWDSVLFYWGQPFSRMSYMDAKEAWKLLYTAVTRSSNYLRMYR